MRYALPLWCCLKPESQTALLVALKRQPDAVFNEPLPVWTSWYPLEQQCTIDDYDKYKRIDRFMREKPRHLVKVK